MLSIIIPVKNEFENLDPLICEIEKALMHYSFEIIFIDDFSIDSTLEHLKKIAEKKPFIKVFQKRNQKIGVGVSLKIGAFQAMGDVILTMDGDFSHNPSDIPKFLKELDEHTDLIIGSRYLKDSIYNMQSPRKIFSRIFNLFLKYLFRVSLTDITSGFRLIRKEKLLSLSLTAEKFDIHPEINLNAFFSRFRIKEIPIVFIQRRRGKSKLSYFQMLFRYLRLILKLMRNSYHYYLE
ncbi:MAG: glycosyltransferase [Candidatus Helarchaeota archaeon]